MNKDKLSNLFMCDYHELGGFLAGAFTEMELQSLPNLLARKNLKEDTTFWLGSVHLSDDASTIWMHTLPNGKKITFLGLRKLFLLKATMYPFCIPIR